MASPPLSPRSTTALEFSLKSPSTPLVKEELTIWNVLYTPGGSSGIKTTLIHVYENREHRFYCIFLTAVTAVRSGIEIIPSAGKLLLDTANWFVDIKSTREEGATIFIGGLVDVIHCIKVTIALPFFAVAGFISPFPSDVFGLFRNMPGDQTKFAIADEKARLAQVLEKKDLQEKAISDAEAELEKVKQELDRTDKALTETKFQRGKILSELKQLEGAAQLLETSKTEQETLTNKITELSSEEKTLKARITSLTGEIAKLEPVLKDALASNDLALTSLQTQRSAQEEALKKVQTELQATQEKKQTTQGEFDKLSNDIRDLQQKAAGLNQEISKLEAAKPKLETTLAELLSKIENQKNELLRLYTEYTQAETKIRATLAELKSQIQGQEKTLSKHKDAIERLQKEEKDLEVKRSKLTEDCRTLEYTTLFNLEKDQRDLEGKIKSCGETKVSLENEIRALQKSNFDETEALKELGLHKKELEETIDKLDKQRLNLANDEFSKLRDSVLKETNKSKVLENEIAAKQKELDGINTNIGKAQIELRDTSEKITAKQAEQKILEENLSRIRAAHQSSPSHSSTASGGAETKETTASLQKELETLNKQISDKSEEGAILAGLIDHKQSALNKQTQEVNRLTQESKSFAAILEGQKQEVEELTKRQLKLEGEIKKLEDKENSLKNQTASLYEQASTLRKSIEEMTPKQKELEGQVAKAMKEKEVADKNLETILSQVNDASRKQKELQGSIDDLSPKVTSAKSALLELEGKKTATEIAYEKLAEEDQELKNQIIGTKNDLFTIQKLLEEAKKNYDGELGKFREEKDLLTKENEQLKKENETNRIDLNSLVTEFKKLTDSTQKLRAEETALKASIDADTKTEAKIIAHIKQETEAQAKLNETTVALSKQVQALTEKATAQAKINKKLETDFAARKAHLEEEFRNSEEEAIRAQEAALAKIRQGSPKKTLEKQNSEAADAEVTRRKEEIEKLKQERDQLKTEIAEVQKGGQAYVAELSTKMANGKSLVERYKAEADEARAKRDHARMTYPRTTIVPRATTPTPTRTPIANNLTRTAINGPPGTNTTPQANKIDKS